MTKLPLIIIIIIHSGSTEQQVLHIKYLEIESIDSSDATKCTKKDGLRVFVRLTPNLTPSNLITKTDPAP